MRRPNKPRESFERVVDARFLEKASLTSKQQTILEAIVFLIRKGELPTVREIGALVGLRSPATVLKHLRVLEKLKLISLSGKSRGIRIADEELLEQVLRPEAEAHLSLHPLSLRPSQRGNAGRGGVPLVGAIAAGQPFESYSDGFQSDELFQDECFSNEGGVPGDSSQQKLPIDPELFVTSGETIALRVEGDSMIQAGILDGDYVIIRRQNSVEEGEIAAVLIDGEGTLKRWRTRSSGMGEGQTKTLNLLPANERFDPIEITEDNPRDVLVIGKYVGLVRGELQIV